VVLSDIEPSRALNFLFSSMTYHLVLFSSSDFLL